jgi:hypothetical protein
LDGGSTQTVKIRSCEVDTLTLYRGDYEKIREFNFHKTKKYCLVGPGVYLTPSLRVAESYRVKGAQHEAYIRPTLFCASAKDRTEAYEKAFLVFHKDKKEVSGIHREKLSEKQEKALQETHRREFITLREEGLITARYTGAGVGTNRVIQVDYKGRPGIGYITEFEFLRKPFSESVVDVCGVISDTTFWEIMFDHKVPYGTPYEGRHEYVTRNSQPYQTRPLPDRTLCDSIRRAVQPFDYKGFRYQGGRYVGGLGAHDAYCIWDDEYVNEHKVRRFK